MSNESGESRDALPVIPSLQARVARYREHAAHFTRLAEAEPIEKIRDQWKTLARDYAYLASTLQADGGPAREHSLPSVQRPASGPFDCEGVERGP